MSPCVNASRRSIPRVVPWTGSPRVHAVLQAEGERIAEAQKRNPNADILFLDNHGVSIGAPTVALAFDELYYLERACKQQAIAQSSGKPLKLMPEEMVRDTNRQMMQQLDWAATKHFDALMRINGL